MVTSYQSTKVFSLESFPLYDSIIIELLIAISSLANFWWIQGLLFRMQKVQKLARQIVLQIQIYLQNEK